MEEVKIAITGASGWVGKNLIVSLHKKMSKKAFRKNIFLYGSKNKELRLNTNLSNLRIRNLSEFYKDALKNNFHNIYHCAFIVREHIPRIGINKYIELNRNITNAVLEGIKQTKSSRLTVFSSGAASFHKKVVLKKDLELDPYGALKREEEIKLSDNANTQIIRIYALTGKYIRNPNSFAISNLLLQAKYESKINLTANRSIKRGYINAKDLCNLSILISNNKKLFNKIRYLNAVSDEITLLELAKLISKKFDNKEINYNFNKNLTEEIYSASPVNLRSISEELGYKLMNINQQIDDTLIGLKEQN